MPIFPLWKIPNYKKSMRDEEFGSAYQQSEYQNNPIKDMGLIMQSDNDDNIFSSVGISY